LIGEGFICFFTFGTNGTIKRSIHPDVTSPMTYFEFFIAGSISGIIASFIVTPSDCAKIRLQLQYDSKNQSKYHGTVDCLTKILKEEGLRSLFKGLPITFIRDVPAWGAYFASFELLRNKTSNEDGTTTLLRKSLSGGIAGAISWMMIYPADVIKTNLQKESTKETILMITKKLYNKGGIKVFYRGTAPTLIRSIPVNAIVLVVYEDLVKWSHALD